MKKPEMKDEDYPTTGHSWDGIREYDKPMPRWWLITFVLTVVWGLGYTIAYPAWPLINGATAGLLGWSSRGDVAAEIQTFADQNAALEQKLLATELNSIIDDPELAHFASAGGAAVFRTYCAQCHGAGAQGFKGYPNLQDDDWLWGGDLTALETTIAHGIRSDLDEDTRYSEMPKFGEQLSEEQITEVAEYILSLSEGTDNNEAAAAGQVLFADNCASCHLDSAIGDQGQGAPNLKDAIWLFGGDRDTVIQTITNSRFGVMPAWKGRITDAQIRQVTFYVHQLGGGE